MHSDNQGLQVVDSCVLYGKRSIALNNVDKISVSETDLGDTNRRLRFKQILMHLGLAAFFGLFFLSMLKQFGIGSSLPMGWIGVIGVPVLALPLIVYLALKRFPARLRTDYQITLHARHGDNLKLFSTCSPGFIADLAEAFNKAMWAEKEGSAFDWWVDIKNQKILMCRRNGKKRSFVQHLIDVAKGVAANDSNNSKVA